jgi:hypothetical protein
VTLTVPASVYESVVKPGVLKPDRHYALVATTIGFIEGVVRVVPIISGIFAPF